MGRVKYRSIEFSRGGGLKGTVFINVGRKTFGEDPHRYRLIRGSCNMKSFWVGGREGEEDSIWGDEQSRCKCGDG